MKRTIIQNGEYVGPSRGLGDIIAKVTRKLGFNPCRSCRERQALLNQKIPFKKK